MSRHAQPDARRQRGASLVEVLVSMLVLSIGLLGLATLHLWTLRNEQSTLERSFAVVAMHSIVDAMRADRTHAINGAFNLELHETPPAGDDFATSAVESWRANLVALLGDDATGAISCNGSRCMISVEWDDSRGAGGSAQQRLQTEVQL